MDNKNSTYNIETRQYTITATTDFLDALEEVMNVYSLPEPIRSPNLGDNAKQLEIPFPVKDSPKTPENE